MSAKKKKVKTNYRPYFFHYLYCLAIIALLLFTSININKFLETQKVLGTAIDTTPLQTERDYWQNIVDKNPTYIDGYLQLAKVEVELGNKNAALLLITQALNLDPNSPKIPKVTKELGL